MGKIKSKQVKRASKELMENGIDFHDDFEKNKNILGSEMPSKKMRNKMAGYLSRFMNQQKKEAAKLEVKK
ncbi:30S ribosomal protein S17e [Candidatus Pacearchaeota archaeon CG10_big_fil_rev_8_21_14_0_10_32_42]|nr:MAG: 30S ribosomal protein S17e [Candidatus Pacearchaeota archaeon CG10_big_fil_rev_8_21_14_0_10_32_42]